MRVGLLSSIFLALTISIGGCGGDDDVDSDGGNGDGNSSSAGVVSIASVSPDHGPLAGGTLLTITGEGFLLNDAQPNTVIVGGIQCPAVQLVDDNSIIVETPAGESMGAVDVIVYNSNGFDTGAGLFSYNPLPTVTAVAADNGLATGGETVTVTGTGFQNLEAGTNMVFFGENEAADVVVASDTSLTATAPPNAAFALVDVAVVNANGAGELPRSYEYTAPGERLLALSRASSSSCGGCDVAGKPGYFGAPYADAEPLPPLEVATLFHVDPVTGAVASITEAETWLTALARAPDGTVYGMATNKISPVELQRNLVIVNTTTGELTPVGPTGLVQNTQDLTFIGPVMFGNSWRSGSSAGLHTINTATGAATGVGGSGLTSGGNGLAFDGTTLYNSNNDGLCKVNSSTGAVAECVGTARNMNGLSIANGKLYGATYDYFDYAASALWEIDKETGNLIDQVGTIPGRVVGMTTLP